jgi:hypothetical protein
MLIGYAGHRGWVAFTTGLFVLALAAYCLLGRSPEGDPPSGNTVVGMWFGIAGYACMVFAALLSLLRRAPSWWWIGSRSWWLKGHIWLGLLTGPLILFHSGFHVGGLLEQVLWVLLILVLGSGIVGLLLQQILPHYLATHFTEMPYEGIRHACALLREKADALMDALCPSADADDAQSNVDAEALWELRLVYDKTIRPFLGQTYLLASPLARSNLAEAVFRDLYALPGMEKRAELEEMEGFCRDRRSLGQQERVHHWLHGWLLTHIPLSSLLLALGAAHAVISLYY